MPKRYRIQLALLDEDDRKVSESSHDEMYNDDDQAKKRFEQKAQAAQRAGKP